MQRFDDKISKPIIHIIYPILIIDIYIENLNSFLITKFRYDLMISANLGYKNTGFLLI